MVRWVALSIVLHGLLLLIFTDLFLLTVTGSPREALAAISATLRSKQEASSIKSPDVESVKAPKIINRRSVVSDSHASKPTTVAGIPSESQAEASIVPSEAPSVVAGVETQIGELRAKPLEIISQDGLREYRFNLSREARRYKRYPALARQRGLEGIVVVVISAKATQVAPQVALGRSSGQDVLDQQALEMLNLAARDASMPESLRGRNFVINLPIHFSLDE